MLLLPGELLNLIVEYLAHTFDAPDLLPLPRYRHVSPELCSLSTANKRLRQVCLPFLFAYVRIRHVGQMEKLRDRCLNNSTCSKSIKIITLSNFVLRREEGHEILYNLLPNLEHLSCVDLTGCYLSATLLSTLHEHPSISTLLVGSLRGLPRQSTFSDLSKVTLVRTEQLQSDDPMLETLQNCLERGMKVAQLIVWKPHLLREDFRFERFQGLHVLEMKMNYFPITLSWLAEFTLAHSQLERIELIDDEREYFRFHREPFVYTFMEQLSQAKLSNIFYLNRLTLTRANSRDWEVYGMTLTVWRSLVEVLAIVYASFPDIKALDLDLENHNVEYDIDDLISVLSKFSSLRNLSLRFFFKRLRLKAEDQEMPSASIRQVTRNDPLAKQAARTEDTIRWYLSRMARRIPSLEAVHINERYPTSAESRWSLAGWLYIHGGTRDVEGALQLGT